MVIESFQSDDTYANTESEKYGSFNPIPEPNFKIVKKKYACNESPKPIWEPFIYNLNRFSPIALSESDEEKMPVGLHNTTKNQSKGYTGNLKIGREKKK